MYTNKEKTVLLCIVNRKEIPIIKEIVKNIDETAFLIVHNVRETLGEGFKDK